MTRPLIIFELAVLLLTATGASRAFADEGNDILKKVNAMYAAPKDQTSTAKMTLKEADGSTKVRELQTKQKGSALRLSVFTSPADVKGVAFLARSDDEMYVYMPEFGKIRRIASHVKKENFMGTDFSYSDMGSSDWAKTYDARVTKREAKNVLLELLPRKYDEVDYGKLTMLVDTSTYMALRIQYFDKKGTLWKEMTQTQIKKISSYWVAGAITMRDLKKNHSTTIEQKDISFDRGLKDDDFSTRALKRSR